MTSRETADCIDTLIELRIELSHMLNHEMANPKAISVVVQKIEVQKCALADALKRLDHNPGVYKG